MIHVTVSIGSGARKAAVLSDSLIGDEVSAEIRGRQELAKSCYIATSRTLEVPHDPSEGHAHITSEFSYQPLNITGRHLVVSRSISLTPTWCGDSVTLEQYKYLEFPS